MPLLNDVVMTNCRIYKSAMDVDVPIVHNINLGLGYLGIRWSEELGRIQERE